MENFRYPDAGDCAIVQAFPQNIYEKPDQAEVPRQDDYLAHPASHLLYKYSLTMTDSKIDLYLVKVVEMFDSPALAIPYDAISKTGLKHWLIHKITLKTQRNP